MSQEDVRTYYAQLGEREWARLERQPDGMIEWLLTCRALAAHVPGAARVLDIGGGPGRYAIWLAQRGHRVVLADLSAELLDSARAHIAAAGVDGVEEIVEADACDLGRWHDASFDAVVCLGPFYHLPEPERRDQAARELVRVLRPGGVAAIMLMPRWTFLRRTLSIPDERHHILDLDFVERLLDDGEFRNDVRGRFTAGYGARPDEVVPYFARFGLEPAALLAAESISVGIESSIVELARGEPALFERAIDLLWRTASEPSLLGMCNHLLYIGRKASAGAWTSAREAIEP